MDLRRLIWEDSTHILRDLGPSQERPSPGSEFLFFW
jgi:hypothetical protein